MFNLNLTDSTSASSAVLETSGSNGGDTCSTRAAPSPVNFTFNFDILNNNKVNGNDNNNSRGALTLTESGLFVTRELFPASEFVELSLGGVKYGVDQPVVHRNVEVQQVKARKSRRGPRSRSSQYRGVTFYRRTGRWESHIWDCGKQVYLGGFDTALSAARAYDRAAIKFRGVEADINFILGDYEEDMKQTKNLSKEEFVHTLRRQSSGLSRGRCKHGGATMNKCLHPESRIGQFLDNKVCHDNKGAIKCKQGNITVVDSRTYVGEMIPQPRNDDGGEHYLDLNLGISTTSPKDNANFGSFQFRPDYVPNAPILKLNAKNSGTRRLENPPLEGLPVMSQHPFTWTTANPKIVPNYEGMLSERRSELYSSHEVTNREWKMNGKLRTAPIATLSSAAASSGFSLTPLGPTYPIALNLHLASYPTSSTNIPHYDSPCLNVDVKK